LLLPLESFKEFLRAQQRGVWMTRTINRLLPGLTAALLVTAGLGGAIAAELGPHWEESGQASWYGPGFQGRRTSSGETFNTNEMTAAHDTLPLGTRVRVTTQETGRSAVVTITDRLPPKRLRIIDLSRAAASKLGLIGPGVGFVTITPATEDDPVEVAEAPDDGVSPRLHGPRHRRPVGRRVSARH
jgi:rare lipoprotein A